MRNCVVGIYTYIYIYGKSCCRATHARARTHTHTHKIEIICKRDLLWIVKETLKKKKNEDRIASIPVRGPLATH